MIISITLIIASLVAVNFLLLVFSCNKTSKKEVTEIISYKKQPTLVANQLETRQLAPTGS